MRKKKFDGGPDFYIRHNNKVFIFESKDSVVAASLKGTGDFTLLLEDLKSKFQQSGKKPKATKQLMNVAREILSGNFLKIDGGYEKKGVKIYPILVIHDRQLNVPGFNKILSAWFEDEKSYAAAEMNTQNIKPITVIDATTLILFNELFVSRQLPLESIIDEYQEFIKIKKNYKSEAEFEQHARDTMLPFSDFIRHIVYRKKLKRFPERLLHEKAFQTLNQMPLTIESSSI